MRTLTIGLMALLVSVPLWADGPALIEKAQAAEKAGNRNEALTAYGAALKAGDLTPVQRGYAHYRRGSIHGFLGNNIDGIKEFSKSLEANPKQGAAYSLRGYLRGTVGQYDLAEKDHQAAIKLAKEQQWESYLPWVLQHHADLYRRRGQYDKALALADKADRAGSYPAVQFRRAWIYLDMERLADAKTEFQKFDEAMKRENISYDVFWPDERGAIARLRELR